MKTPIAVLAAVAGLSLALMASGCGGDGAPDSTTARAAAANGEVVSLPETRSASRNWEICAMGDGGSLEEITAAFTRRNTRVIRPVYAPRCDLNRPWGRVNAFPGASLVRFSGEVAQIRIREA